MRTNKEELERLRIKSQLGQKIITYQQAKNTEKAQQQKQKFILKQQIMQDILRKKYNPDPEPQSLKQKPQSKVKGDSKLYSFGFPSPHSYLQNLDHHNNHHNINTIPDNHESYLTSLKQNQTSRAQQQSSMPYVASMRNKYVIPQSKSQVSQNNYIINQPMNHDESSDDRYQSDEQHQQQQQIEYSSNPSIKYIDKQIPSNSYAFDENKSNKYSIQNKSNRYDISEKSNHLSNVKINEYSDFGSFGRQNPINFTSTEDLRQKSKERERLKGQTLSHSKFLESSVSIKPDASLKRIYKQQPEPEQYEQHEQQPIILNEVDEMAYNLSRQYMKNKSNKSIKANNSSKNFEDEQREIFKTALPPKPEKTKEKQKLELQFEQSGEQQYQYQPSSSEDIDYNNHKAYGGYIKQGQKDDEYLEQLRKQKIMKLEKKRLERSEERKKSQEITNLHRLEKSTNIQSQRKQSYNNLHKKQKEKEKEKDRKVEQYYANQSNLRLPPLLPNQKTPNLPPPKSRTSSQAQHTRSSGFDKTSQRQRKSSPHQGSSIQSSSSKGLLKTPKSSIFQLSPNRPKDKSLGRLFQDPKIQPKQRKQTFNKQSNKKMMMNSITNVCLPGEINRKEREKLLQVLDNSSCEYFIFLFKQYSRNVIKAVYTYDSSSGSVTKVYGDKAPQEIHEEDVQKFYRFDSGAKEFKVLDGCKSFSYAVHAVYIK